MCVSRCAMEEKQRETETQHKFFLPFFFLWLRQQMLLFRNKIKSATFISWALNYGYIVIKSENSVRLSIILARARKTQFIKNLYILFKKVGVMSLV